MKYARMAWALLFAATGASALGGCTVSTPFQGPAAKAPLDDGQPPALLAITHVRLGSNLARNIDFWKQIGRVVDAAERQPGYLGHALRRKLLVGEGWTMTAWADEASLQAFVRSDAHQRAIREGVDAIAHARFVRVTVDRADLPLSWQRAEQILAADAASRSIAP